MGLDYNAYFDVCLAVQARGSWEAEQQETREGSVDLLAVAELVFATPHCCCSIVRRVEM